MNKTVKFFIFTLFLSVGVPGACHANRNTKIAVVDFKELWTNLSAVKNLKKDLEITLKRYHEEFSTVESSLRKENETLLALANDSSREQEDITKLDKRRDAFEKKVLDTQKKAEKRQRIVNKAHSAAINKIKEITEEVVKKVAEKQKIDMVIYKENILYHTPSLDITKFITKEVESKTKNIKLKTEI